MYTVSCKLSQSCLKYKCGQVIIYYESCLFSISLADVEEFKLNEYTLEHMQAFGMYNHLHLDPWYEDSVLFVDSKGRILSLTVILVSN